MAYKFQSGDAILSGGLLQEGNVEVESGFSFKMHESTILDTSRNLANVGTISGSGAIQGASVSVDGVVSAGGFTIGSAVINEAELEQIDGITAGTVAASKALVVDSNKDISGLRNVTATGAFIIGSANLNEADMEQIDGITAGTVAASKAVVVDSNKDISGLRNVTATGYFEIGSAQLTESELEMLDGITAGTAAASKALVLDASQVLDGSSSMIVSASALSASTGQFNHLTVAANSLTIGSTTLNEAELAVVDGVTAGTVAASKAVVVDSNKDADGWRNISGSGLFEADRFAAGRSITAGGAITAGSSFIIGSADLSEVDMEKLDGITNGTVAASKAVVVDSNKDASGFRHVTATGAVTAGTSFIIGSADLNEADLEKLDGITNGTAAASKAVVLDANKDISSLRDLSARDLTLSGLSEGLVTFAQSNGKLGDDNAMAYNDDGMGGGKFFQVRSRGPVGNNYTGIMAKTGSISVLNAAEDGLLAYLGYDGTISGSNELHITGHAKFQDNIYASGSLALAGNADLNGQLDVASSTTLGGTLTAASLGSATVDLTADLMVIDDGAAGAIKTTSLANYATALAGGSNEGLKSTAGRLALDHNDLAAAAISVASDSFAFVDADDSNKTKKESVADLMTAVAGDGLAASSGVLAVGVDDSSIEINSDALRLKDDGVTGAKLAPAVADLGLSQTGDGNLQLDLNELVAEQIASGDFLAFVDSTDNGTHKETVDDLASLFAGTGIKAASAVLSLDVQELSQAAVASGDFFVIEDATDNSTKKESVDDLATLFAGNGLAAASAVLSVDLNELSAASVDVANDSIAIIDANDSNGSKKESIVDLVSAMAGAGLTAASGQLKVTGNDVSLKADGDTLVEGYNYFADISADAGVTLPAAPSVGDVVHVKAGDISGANVEITISRAGSQVIDNDLTAIYLESSFAALSLVYVANNEWRII